MIPPVISLQEVSKDYLTEAGVCSVLRSIHLSVAPGDFVSLMGPSGSGKSTLLSILGCLDSPTSGKYVLNGEDVSVLGPDQQSFVRNRLIGFVFQDFNLLPRMSLEYNTALPLLYAGVPRTERLSRARASLEQVGLGHRMRFLPSQISGGERQRAAIARALINSPKLILADEPTGNLDTANSKAILEMLLALNRQGITIFMVTHDREVAAYAKRLIHLRDGRITSDKIVVQGGARAELEDRT